MNPLCIDITNIKEKSVQDAITEDYLVTTTGLKVPFVAAVLITNPNYIKVKGQEGKGYKVSKKEMEKLGAYWCEMWQDTEGEE